MDIHHLKLIIYKTQHIIIIQIKEIEKFHDFTLPQVAG